MTFGRAERWPLAIFLTLALMINVVASAVTRSITDPSRQVLVTAGACFDVIFVISALYYWLLVRPGLRSPLSLCWIALAGLLRSAFLVPIGAAGKTIALTACEGGLLAIVIYMVRRSRRSIVYPANSDAVTHLQTVVATVIPIGGLARLFAHELAVWCYALGIWRKPRFAPDRRTFTVHQRSGKADLLAIAGIASLFEIIPMHLLLRRWSLTGAWIATSMSMYGAVWLMAVSRSFSARPTVLAKDLIAVRLGLLLGLDVTRSDIADIHRNDSGIVIELKQPMTAWGPMGIPRKMTRIEFKPDDPSGFLYSVTEWMRAE